MTSNDDSLENENREVSFPWFDRMSNLSRCEGTAELHRARPACHVSFRFVSYGS